MQSNVRTTLFVIIISTLVGCRPTDNSSKPQHRPDDSTSDSNEAPVAAANSLLAAAYRDVMGQGKPVVMLAEPGMCPGHFDLRPSQVRRLRSCRFMLRFDFQHTLDSRLSEDHAGHLRVVSVTISGGICEPESYLSACRQIGQALVKEGWLTENEAEKRLAAVRQRMNQLDHWAKNEIENAGLRGKPVLCSGHQAAFCRYLGLNVVAEFSAADTASPSQIDRAIKAGEQAKVGLVVANLPEGRRLADALADRLDAKVAVFGNFPQEPVPQAFNELVRQNVKSLIEASKS